MKTTLTNQDLTDVATSASMLPNGIPLLILSFDSQASLKAIDTAKMPENVIGITLSHGSILRGEDHWNVIHPSNRAPLIEFYSTVLQQLLKYALRQEESSGVFIRVLETLMNQISTEVTSAESLSYPRESDRHLYTKRYRRESNRRVEVKL